MKLVIISDTHFGDSQSVLVRRHGAGYRLAAPMFERFRECAGQGNDYLVLLGDVFDFSVQSYEEVFRAARVFFEAVKKSNIAEEILYVPGNHDFDMWHTLEYQTRIIMPIEKGELPERLRHSVPAVVDGRKTTTATHRLVLHGVTDKNGKYGGTFLDSILGKGDDDRLRFNVPYPNVYLVTDRGTALLTHGQYFDPYWSIAAEWLMKIAQEDLRLGDALDLKELVALNSPLSQLACTGIGQAGPLTRLVQELEHQIKAGRLRTIRTYLDRLDHEIDELTRYPWYKPHREWLTDMISDKVKNAVLQALEDHEPARFSDKHTHSKGFSHRFWSFFKATLCEIDELNQAGHSVPTPRWVIHGHTHRPIPWDPQAKPLLQSPNVTDIAPIRRYNTGGWINRTHRDGSVNFCGAEVFLFDSDTGFSSESIVLGHRTTATHAERGE